MKTSLVRAYRPAFKVKQLHTQKDYEPLPTVINLATRHHLVLRLRMNGGTSPGRHIPRDGYRVLYFYFTYGNKISESHHRRMPYVMKFVPRHFDKRILQNGQLQKIS
jgi:hypothetical protein